MARVVVLGGGISGLAAAQRLVRAGVEVVLLEGSDRLGGLGTTSTRGGVTVERFYHCVMPSDEHLLPLLDEIGLGGTVDWAPTTMGMVVESERRPFNTALDLLRFRPLTLLQRLRFGIVSLLLRPLGRGRDLDHLRTEDWLRRLYGDVIWERMLSPMFGSKFGPAFGDVPALYLWQRLGRERNTAVRGYPRGGYRAIIDALQAAVVAGGGVVRTGAPVASLSADAHGVVVELEGGERVEADWAVSTLPLPALRAVADPDLAPALPTVRLAYQGVVNAVFLLRRGLDGHYWAPVIDSGAEFDGVVEMSALTGPRDGRHVAYAMHYCDRGADLFAEPDEEIARRWTEQLLAVYADVLTAEDVLEVRVFRAPFVEPVYPLGYGTAKPAAEVPGARLLLATTAQVYPEVTSWNSSTGLAHRVVDGLLERLAAPGCDPADNALTRTPRAVV